MRSVGYRLVYECVMLCVVVTWLRLVNGNAMPFIAWLANVRFREVHIVSKQIQDAYIVAATRTPVGKAPRGMFATPVG